MQGAPAKDKKRFVAIVMALMYAVVRVRVDGLFTVGYLSTKCANPTRDDEHALDHALRYFNATIDMEMEFKPESLEVHAWVDASFMLHPDKKGQTGVAIRIGKHGPCVSARSSKQKMITTSSTDSEVLSAFEAMPQITIARQLIEAFGYDTTPILHQDNKSAITMMHNGQGSAKHTKHFDMRLQFLKEAISNGEIELEYTPTEEMVADMLTKPMSGRSFDTYVKALMGKELRGKAAYSALGGGAHVRAARDSVGWRRLNSA